MTRLVGWRWPQGSILVAFTAATTIAFLSIILKYGVLVDILSYGFTLLEESLVFIRSSEDQHGMTPKYALVRHPKELLPPWRNLFKLFWRCEDIMLSLASMTAVLPDSLSALGHPIVWCPPDAGIIFGVVV